MSSDRVSPFIYELCRMDRFGGRCLRLDGSSWEVLDVQQWTEDHATALRHRFPRVSAKVVANCTSLTGFSILLQTHRASHAWTSLLVCATMIASCAGLVWTMRTHESLVGS